MKIYTKFGDTGNTSLGDGSRVAKHDVRVEAYGTVDELHAQIALLRDSIRGSQEIAEPRKETLASSLFRVQNELFLITSELANPGGIAGNFPYIEDKSVDRLEQEIDAFTGLLEPLTRFVLPGGHPLCSLAHVSRTVARRAERCMTQLGQQEGAVRTLLLMYLNRLSDWLFTLSRILSLETHTPEIIWDYKNI